ncbi:hypothetical protein WN51_04596 [Melipona quadrifasciata]|uniref:Uncharacterized protein n=1 Tax=Melipona quadrifasciata TaxID=166423 RepID=A0A0M8ZV00_9HYME|nr:hypothetical protein WN51_04596 [Melipona quadrifasciata]
MSNKEGHITCTSNWQLCRSSYRLEEIAYNCKCPDTSKCVRTTDVRTHLNVPLQASRRSRFALSALMFLNVDGAGTVELIRSRSNDKDLGGSSGGGFIKKMRKEKRYTDADWTKKFNKIAGKKMIHQVLRDSGLFSEATASFHQQNASEKRDEKDPSVYDAGRQSLAVRDRLRSRDYTDFRGRILWYDGKGVSELDDALPPLGNVLLKRSLKEQLPRNCHYRVEREIRLIRELLAVCKCVNIRINACREQTGTGEQKLSTCQDVLNNTNELFNFDKLQLGVMT